MTTLKEAQEKRKGIYLLLIQGENGELHIHKRFTAQTHNSASPNSQARSMKVHESRRLGKRLTLVRVM